MIIRRFWSSHCFVIVLAFALLNQFMNYEMQGYCHANSVNHVHLM